VAYIQDDTSAECMCQTQAEYRTGAPMTGASQTPPVDHLGLKGEGRVRVRGSEMRGFPTDVRPSGNGTNFDVRLAS